MAATEITNIPLNGNINDKFNIDGHEIQLKVSYKFITGNESNTDEYYEIKTRSNILFKIDKDQLKHILCYIDDNQTYNAMGWEYDRHNKKFIISLFNNSYINIINYLKKDYANLKNRKINFKFINGDDYDFRFSNLEKIPILGKKSSKYKHLDIKPEFIPSNLVADTIVVQSYEGHVKTNGCTANKARNKYKLVEITKQDGTKVKYYEIDVNNLEDNNINFTFIIDEEDKCILDNVYFTNNKVYCKIEDVPIEDKNKIITIKNPTWRLLDQQYVALSIDIKGYDQYLVYIHRLLLGCQKDDMNTVDHINGNKFDNRRSNLRIASMSVQNQNRDNVKRDTTLNDILNPEKKTDIPKLSFTNLKFIMFREENSECFDIECKPGRSLSDKIIKYHSTKAKIFKDDNLKARRIKLCHAICIRYLMAIEYPNIIKEKIDNKNFTSIDDFKTNSNTLITEVMSTQYTVDTFLDYMNTLKIPKYTDPRKPKTASNVTPINDIKFDGIQYSSERDKYNASFDVNKKDTPRKKITFDGSGSKNLSTEDKKCFALVQRYNLLITLENDINTQLHSDTPFTGTNNTNTTNLKCLTDFDFETESKTKFANFTELRTYTEECINKFLTHQTPYTLETFADYVTKKANSKKINLAIQKLQYNYPVLTSLNTLTNN